MFRKLLYNDKMPALVLFVTALVGVMIGCFLVCRCATEAGGSGIPKIEDALE